MLTLMIISAVILSVCVFVAHAEMFLFESWSELNPDEIFYHIMAPLEGADTSLIIKGLLSFGLYTLFLLCALIVIALFLGRDKKIAGLYSALCFFTAVLMGISTLADAENKSNIISYVTEAYWGETGSFIEEYYIDPKNVDLTFPEEKRNLIYIFLESMESTYADFANGGGFPVNVIPELTELSKNYLDFSGNDETINGFYSLPGANWTAAAMYAAGSGLPIKMAFEGEAFLRNEGFFPEIECLGDILEREGYSNNIIMGSNIEFGARRSFFESHGNYNMHDYLYFNDNNLLPYENHFVFWGIEDKILFEKAKDEILELSKSEEPFNYTLLTVDTHFEDGYVCDLCEDKYKDQYSDVMACSSKQVNDFISWIQKQDFYENTTIVISGDHTTMDTDFCDNVPSDYERKGYFCLINPAKEYEDVVERKYSIFDIFPTVVAALGADIPGEKLGLGVNLFSGTETLSEKLGVENLSFKLSKPSKFYEKYNVISEDSHYIENLSMIISPVLVTEDSKEYINIYKINMAISRDEKISGRIVAKLPKKEVQFKLKKKINNINSPQGYTLMADITKRNFDLKDAEFSLYLKIGENEEYKVCEFNFDGEKLITE